MTETVGFDARAALHGLFVCAILLGPPLVTVLVAGRFFLRLEGRALGRSAAAAIAGVLLGAAVAEVSILADEAAFLTAVAAAPTEEVWRPRAWPHGACALGHVPGQGVFATD